jgi:uncharacterized protein (DUF302 family)
MEKIMLRIVLLSTLFMMSACVNAGSQRDEYMKLYTVEGKFEDVRMDVEFAITDRGMVINNVSHIGNMLARTGEDIGAGKQIFQKAEALEFCSASVSRRMMEADPHNIVFCPYIIAIYTLPDESNKVHVAFRKPLPVGSAKSRQSLQAVEQLLEDIVADAIP